MQIVEYQEKLLPSLTRLINEQISAVPPGFALREGQVADTIAQGGTLWDIHVRRERRELYAPEVLCVLERREVVAAAQWFFLVKEGVISIQWLVAQPGRPIPLRTLLHLIDKWGDMRGANAIHFARFAFGVGWFGLPARWTHVIDPMLESGYRQTDKWSLLIGETSAYGSAAPPDTKLEYHWNMNKPVLEWELSGYQGDRLVGESQVWGIPPHLEDCSPASEWATVELVEVEKAYRRHGIGKWLLAEQMRFHARRGVQHMIAWTRDSNRAGRKLLRGMGFEYGPKLVVLEKP
ncbi:MAG: GNAT family N-acetyltransferase [Anaerolineae bacterium]|nr:GNAT family N-acetyltransferase [Anaerolineae bacterium]